MNKLIVVTNFKPFSGSISKEHKTKKTKTFSAVTEFTKITNSMNMPSDK